jgi:hypothetical protein
VASVRVSEELYRELNRVAGEMRLELGQPVSMEDSFFWQRGYSKRVILPRAWKMSDNEGQRLKKDLEEYSGNLGKQSSV